MLGFDARERGADAFRDGDAGALAVGAAAPAGRRVHERLADRGELGACAPRAYLN